MANKTFLSVIQLNDSHAYFDLHLEIFWQGGMRFIVLQVGMRALPH